MLALSCAEVSRPVATAELLRKETLWVFEANTQGNNPTSFHSKSKQVPPSQEAYAFSASPLGSWRCSARQLEQHGGSPRTAEQRRAGGTGSCRHHPLLQLKLLLSARLGQCFQKALARRVPINWGISVVTNQLPKRKKSACLGNGFHMSENK